MNVASIKQTIVRLELKQTAVILAVSVVLPYIFHLFPAFGGIPAGARFIPMFYAPFIAVILFRPHVAIVTSLLSPILNSLLTGHPTQELILSLTLQLVVFSMFAYSINSHWRGFRGTALVAYFLAVSSVAFLFGSISFFINTIGNALPGIAVLFFINIFLSRYQ